MFAGNPLEAVQVDGFGLKIRPATAAHVNFEQKKNPFASVSKRATDDCFPGGIFGAELKPQADSL